MTKTPERAERSSPGRHTYRLRLEYDGTRYHGWQEQVRARTVAGELRRAAERLQLSLVELQGSGRTDAGVHALEQVAHVRLGQRIDPEPVREQLNELLPADIHLLALDEAPARFHARHGAAARSYLYQISRRRTAFAKRFVWWVRRPLDAERMAEAAGLLVGRHDFALLTEKPAQQASTIVVVERAEVVESGALLLLRVVASHFLWKMVRRIAGVLVEIGGGALAPRDLAGLLGGKPLAPNRGPVARWTAPPSGLFLERVLYPGDPPLGRLAPAFPVCAARGRGDR